MIFRNLDENHDWTFGKGINNYLRKDDAIAINVKTRILSWVNDCFFAQDAGIDWYNRLGKLGQRRALEEDLKNIILRSEDVLEIVSISTSLEDRGLNAEYTINTINSTVIDAVQVGV